jgi:hypothetical protein
VKIALHKKYFKGSFANYVTLLEGEKDQRGEGRGSNKEGFKKIIF